jgi:hypothetical protein
MGSVGPHTAEAVRRWTMDQWTMNNDQLAMNDEAVSEGDPL